MEPRPGIDTPGIVDPRAAFDHFRLERIPPPDELAWCLDWFWHVRWDLPAGTTYDQPIVTHPAFNVVFETDGARVHGVSRNVTVKRLTGTSQALGLKFRPAGFAPLVGVRAAAFTDRVLDVADVLGPAAGALARRATTVEDMSTLVGEISELLGGLEVPDAVREGSMTISRAVDAIAADPAVATVGNLAERLELSVRRLQQLFADLVGVPPRWVINRARVHEAAEAAARDSGLSWADLAADLGYADQPHLTRAFRAAVGVTPGRYRAAQHAPRPSDHRRPIS